MVQSNAPVEIYHLHILLLQINPPIGVRTRNGNLSTVRSSLLVDWRANGAQWPVRKKLHAKEGSRAMQRRSRSRAVAISDFVDRNRGASNSRRSHWCVPISEELWICTIGPRQTEGRFTRGEPQKRSLA